MITIVRQHSTTLHIHMAHRTVVSRMQVLNESKEGGRASFMLEFSSSSAMKVSHPTVCNRILDIGRLVASYGVGEMLLVFFHWVIVVLEFSWVVLFRYVFSFYFYCLAPMESPIILIVFWRNGYVLRLKMRRKWHRDLWMEIEYFYEVLFVLCIPIFMCYGIFLSSMGILWVGRLSHLLFFLYLSPWHDDNGISLVNGCHNSGFTRLQLSYSSFQILAP